MGIPDSELARRARPIRSAGAQASAAECQQLSMQKRRVFELLLHMLEVQGRHPRNDKENILKEIVADCDRPDALNIQILPRAFPCRARSTSRSSTVLISKPVRRELPRVFALSQGHRTQARSDIISCLCALTALKEASAGRQSENRSRLGPNGKAYR